MTRLRAALPGLALLALLVPACDDDDPPAPTLTLGTYNAGLAVGFVEHAAERAPVTTAALAALDFDVLCVQEYWQPAHRDALYAAVADALPYTTHHEADPGACEPACTADDVDPLVACMDRECPDVGVGDVISCALEHCGAEVDALPGPCLTCIGGEVGDKTVSELVAACGPDAMSASCYAYAGEFGTALLTRHEVLDRDLIVMDSSLNRRGVLYNKLATDLGEVHVFCTHLSAVFSDIPHPAEADGMTWLQEQADQIAALRAWVDTKATDGAPVVLLGDYNCGPEIPGRVPAEFPENYAALAEGYRHPYAESPDADCTFCNSNPLVGSDAPDHDGAELIDHVLVRGFGDLPEHAARILDGAIDLEVDGMSVRSAYSDHYGVRVVLGASTPAE